ncbi:MAG: hypothetical protein AAF514_11360 [Verrucomicrobiota bacterium]
MSNPQESADQRCPKCGQAIPDPTSLAPGPVPEMSWWARYGHAFLSFVVGFVIIYIGTAIGTYVQPREFQSWVELEIKPDQLDPMTLEVSTDLHADLSAQFMHNQVEIVLSKETLERVVRELSLDESWGLSPQDAYRQLRLNIDAFSYPNTKLVVIAFQSNDSSMAARIANVVADQYIQRRREMQWYPAAATLDTLQVERKAQEARAKEAHLKWIQFKATESNESDRLISYQKARDDYQEQAAFWPKQKPGSQQER